MTNSPRTKSGNGLLWAALVAAAVLAFVGVRTHQHAPAKAPAGAASQPQAQPDAGAGQPRESKPLPPGVQAG